MDACEFLISIYFEWGFKVEADGGRPHGVIRKIVRVRRQAFKMCRFRWNTLLHIDWSNRQ